MRVCAKFSPYQKPNSYVKKLDIEIANDKHISKDIITGKKTGLLTSSVLILRIKNIKAYTIRLIVYERTTDTNATSIYGIKILRFIAFSPTNAKVIKNIADNDKNHATKIYSLILSSIFEVNRIINQLPLYFILCYKHRLNSRREQ